MQITLDKEGYAVLQMLDKPIIEDLGDIRNMSRLYNEGIECYYSYATDTKGYYVYSVSRDYLYDVSALKLVQTIYLDGDGYVYYCYTNDSRNTDEDCGNRKRVTRYTRIK